MQKNIEEVINFIESNTLIGIKAGEQRETFSEIWMVTYNNRIFARSWGLTERSWYNSFLDNENGKIKCGDIICDIKAIIPKDLVLINECVNQSYIDKYDFGDNSEYANEMIKPKHYNKTMEFIIL